MTPSPSFTGFALHVFHCMLNSHARRLARTATTAAALSIAAAALAYVLPLPYALASPLYMGAFGWLVDMLPLVILLGWAVVVVRWALGVLRERRWPRGGRWTWIPIGLVVWTGLGILVITSLDFKHFLLLLGIQVLASGAESHDFDYVEPVLVGLCAPDTTGLGPDIWPLASEYRFHPTSVGVLKTATAVAGAIDPEQRVASDAEPEAAASP